MIPNARSGRLAGLVQVIINKVKMINCCPASNGVPLAGLSRAFSENFSLKTVSTRGIRENPGR